MQDLRQYDLDLGVAIFISSRAASVTLVYVDELLKVVSESFVYVIRFYHFLSERFLSFSTKLFKKY